jgi:hypothetical protein
MDTLSVPCGDSSMVEPQFSKLDVASSSLVPRSMKDPDLSGIVFYVVQLSDNNFSSGNGYSEIETATHFARLKSAKAKRTWWTNQQNPALPVPRILEFKMGSFQVIDDGFTREDMEQRALDLKTKIENQSKKEKS